MQLSTRILQGSWTEPAGWTLIVAGLVLALWTLGEKSRQRLRFAVARPQRLIEVGTETPAEPDSQWQRLVDIVEPSLARAEAVAEAQARAIEEIEAADALLAEYFALAKPSEVAAQPQERGVPEPLVEPTDRPLAA